MSTPNRLTFPPGNPFHERELTAPELHDRLCQLVVVGTDDVELGAADEGCLDLVAVVRA